MFSFESLSFAFPWAFLALPLPFLVNRFLPETSSVQDAGLKVPSFGGFAVLADRSRVESELRLRSRELAGGSVVEGILFHKAFPVDVRHNAKIHRLELKRWAEEEVLLSGSRSK